MATGSSSNTAPAMPTDGMHHLTPLSPLSDLVVHVI
jgi:hypothetical protein